jgi:enamine deaminase RidA (YjgF/YER057c/UK114 family)
MLLPSQIDPVSPSIEISREENDMQKFVVAAIAVLLSTAAIGQEVETSAGTVIESGGRTVIFTEAVPKERTGYDSPWHYAHAIRAGDFVYISGIIIGADQEDSLPISKSRFRELTESVFEVIQRYLATAGASLEGMVKINTFHVLDGENSSLTIDEQALVIAETKAKYAVEPHPAWTAVGTTGLFSPRGIVEIEMVVYAPLSGKVDW